ncbi:polyprenyl synthetase family protein [Sediminibacillus albus]|uniref:Farnesyl diphosphate synthase n=1 Tax=Sediminibacillus albus TaxID=407036 RepID=A0A1G9CX26_9BACI|nr:farnesyl diphosphate synthase [Sediminibacillus albus]SDK55954.1 geranylgeranyl diphosphate synthase, type II [Sediminibacillus albus]
MTGSLAAYLKEKQQLVNDELMSRIGRLSIPSRLKESMKYSAEAGGKRLRPVLLIASCESYGGKTSAALSTSAALEMVHTYSLIHDDLPAMDDDHVRRGKPTNHKQFDEATAILAGDGLLTYSFDIISGEEQLTDGQKVTLIKLLSEAAGPKGMVAGQILDMQAENKESNLQELEQIHTLKTGQLLKYAVVAGALIGGAAKEQLLSLEEYAYYLGLIFQVQDDILDINGDPALIGKPVGSDEGNFKSTYPKLLGLEGAIRQKDVYLDKARQALKAAGVESSILLEITDYFSSRDH